MNWLDLGFIIFIIIFLIIGIKNGFMSSVLSNFTFGTVAIIAFFLYKPIASLINNWFGLKNAIYNSYYAKFVSSSPNYETNLLLLSKDELQPFIKLTLNSGALSTIPKLMFSWFLNNRSLYSKLHSANIESRSLGQMVSSTYASFFSDIIAFAVTFILIYLIVWIVKLLINKLRTVGFIKVIDNILGAFYGIAKGCLILIAVCFVIKLMSPFSFMKGITNYVSGSFFGKVIYSRITDLLDNALSYTDIITSIFK